MNMKLVGIVTLLVVNIGLFASDQALAQKIAQKSKENRIAEGIVSTSNRSISQANKIKQNLVLYNKIYDQILAENKKNQSVMTYDMIRCFSSFGSCESTKRKFRSLHAQLPRFYDIEALKQTQIDMEKISKKLQNKYAF
jgi:hypothetical protein